MMKTNGFTLVELVITLAVASLLLAVAVPSYQGLVRSNRLASSTNELVSALNIARSTAVTRGAPAVLCQSDNQTTCGGSTDWATGFLVFVDANNDTNAGANEIVRVWQGLPDNIALGESDGDVRVTYLPSGRLQGDGADFVLEPSDCGGEALGRLVNVPIGGRPSLVADQECS